MQGKKIFIHSLNLQRKLKQPFIKIQYRAYIIQYKDMTIDKDKQSF